VVAAARAIGDGELGRFREGTAEDDFELFARHGFDRSQAGRTTS
jgi:hypothetical protein